MIAVDSSIALQWVLPESGTAAAVGLLGRPDLVAPDILLVESANVLAKKVRGDFELAHPAYDCCFFACALKTDAAFATRDQPFINRLVAHGHAGRLHFGISAP